MENKHYGYILALDPSGNFEEGKGCTGWILTDGFGKVLRAGKIDAIEYAYTEEFWAAHVDLLESTIEKYKDHLIVVIEDFVLYPHKAAPQSFSRMETARLLGILQITCYNNYQPYVFQKAIEAKARWDNDILIKQRLMKYGGRGRGFLIPDTKGCWITINKHMLDAYRHALHYATFKNFNKKETEIPVFNTGGTDNYR